MRNSTKLKTLLIKYSITLERGEDEIFKLVLTDKQDNSMQMFEGTSYGMVLSKAYSHLLKEVKK
jgi:hypothetical protein